jgi:hypothetical protein
MPEVKKGKRSVAKREHEMRQLNMKDKGTHRESGTKMELYPLS